MADEVEVQNSDLSQDGEAQEYDCGDGVAMPGSDEYGECTDIKAKDHQTNVVCWMIRELEVVSFLGRRLVVVVEWICVEKTLVIARD